MESMPQYKESTTVKAYELSSKEDKYKCQNAPNEAKNKKKAKKSNDGVLREEVKIVNDETIDLDEIEDNFGNLKPPKRAYGCAIPFHAFEKDSFKKLHAPFIQMKLCLLTKDWQDTRKRRWDAVPRFRNVPETRNVGKRLGNEFENNFPATAIVVVEAFGLGLTHIAFGYFYIVLVVYFKGIIDDNNTKLAKTNPLSEIGIDFEAINRKEKRQEKPSKTYFSSYIIIYKPTPRCCFYMEHVSDRLNYFDQQRFIVVVPVTQTQGKRGSMSHRNNHQPSPLIIILSIEMRISKTLLIRLRAANETDTPVKESTKPDRASFFTKRVTHTSFMHSRKPASSVGTCWHSSHCAVGHEVQVLFHFIRSCIHKQGNDDLFCCPSMEDYTLGYPHYETTPASVNHMQQQPLANDRSSTNGLKRRFNEPCTGISEQQPDIPLPVAIHRTEATGISGTETNISPASVSAPARAGVSQSWAIPPRTNAVETIAGRQSMTSVSQSRAIPPRVNPPRRSRAGLETLGGVMTKIILMNTKLLTSTSEVFSTAVEGETCVEINVLQRDCEGCAFEGDFARANSAAFMNARVIHGLSKDTMFQMCKDETIIYSVK
ncbi:stromal 70 kDa heat shock-related protein, chloroplastic [Artemisia annua]|uniref:Stromal 70 kDa heat shock-related protein, chloroplastic n=1 Tax=Artemisia annua TaxID=35608 RepID=A0A2U1LT15_ARTAN|nr:stromal 70 kDa heat shock-related protein, chloroplastic [Artemisia annua]